MTWDVLESKKSQSLCIILLLITNKPHLRFEWQSIMWCIKRTVFIGCCTLNNTLKSIFLSLLLYGPPSNKVVYLSGAMFILLRSRCCCVYECNWRWVISTSSRLIGTWRCAFNVPLFVHHKFSSFSTRLQLYAFLFRLICKRLHE